MTDKIKTAIEQALKVRPELNCEVIDVLQKDYGFGVKLRSYREGNPVYCAFKIKDDDETIILARLFDVHVEMMEYDRSLSSLDYLFDSIDPIPEAAWSLLDLENTYEWYLNRYKYLQNKGETK